MKMLWKFPVERQPPPAADRSLIARLQPYETPENRLLPDPQPPSQRDARPHRGRRRRPPPPRPRQLHPIRPLLQHRWRRKRRGSRTSSTPSAQLDRPPRRLPLRSPPPGPRHRRHLPPSNDPAPRHLLDALTPLRLHHRQVHRRNSLADLRPRRDRSSPRQPPLASRCSHRRPGRPYPRRRPAPLRQPPRRHHPQRPHGRALALPHHHVPANQLA